MGILEIEPELTAVLREFFPDANESKYASWSERIYSDWLPAKALEELLEGDRPTEFDFEDFRMAIKHLQNAQKTLRRLGGHGNDALLSVREGYPALRHATDRIFGNAAGLVSSEIEAMIRQLDGAAGQLKPKEPSLNELFGETEDETETTVAKPRKIAARSVASTCADAFRSFTGRRPAVATRCGEAYGPFLNFVEMIFKTLEINASAETFARKAVARFGD